MLTNILEILIIFILCIFQSIFGLGLLIFGTPIFLILGNDFLSTLNLLLPISLVISLLQIYNTRINKNNLFIKNFNFFTLPSLLVSLIALVVFFKNINIILIVSIVIIAFSLINLLFFKKSIIFFNNSIFKITTFMLIGIIHGFTNLGGSLLSLTSLNINKSKSDIRYCIAYGYFAMSIIQILSINLLSQNKLDIQKAYYLLIPLIVFKFSQLIYNKIKKDKYNLTLNFIAFIFGLYILINELIK